MATLWPQPQVLNTVPDGAGFAPAAVPGAGDGFGGGSPAGGAIWEEGQSALSGPMEGTLRSWRDPWGFIVCPEQFEGDLFVHRDAFTEPPPAGAQLTGAGVQFMRAVDARGRPHAEQVRVLHVPTPEMKEVPGLGALGAAPRPALGDLAALEPKFAILAGQQLVGQVRSWKNEWGFVVSPESFEGDLFCHKENLEDGAEAMAPGARVTFHVAADARGRATALQVKCISEPKDWAGSGAMLHGAVRSFKLGQQWGFLVSPGSCAGDIFFHVESCLPPLRPDVIRPGLEVAFKVDLDKQGRCAAMQIQLAPPVTRTSPATRGPAAMGAIMPVAIKRPRL